MARHALQIMNVDQNYFVIVTTSWGIAVKLVYAFLGKRKATHVIEMTAGLLRHGAAVQMVLAQRTLAMQEVFCVDDADCSDELTCQQSTCRIHMGGIGCRVLSGALDIDNANNKHCLETFVCEKDVCVGDLGASCDPT